MACAKVSLRRPSIGEAMQIKTIGKAKDMNLYATDSLGPPVPIRTPRILVADDDEGIRDLISAVLAPAGFDVNAGYRRPDELGKRFSMSLRPAGHRQRNAAARGHGTHRADSRGGHEPARHHRFRHFSAESVRDYL